MGTETLTKGSSSEATGRIEPVLPTADFYDYESLLEEHERQRLAEVREFCAAEVKPYAEQWWQDEDIPRDVLRKLAKLGIGTAARDGYSRLFAGLVMVELIRADCSMAASFGIHNELFVEGLHEFGSESQKARYLDDALSLKTLGGFALTEPEHGSDVAGGLSTMATRDGDEWVLNGAKRWIGNAMDGDYVLLWARDTSNGAIRGFILDLSLPGIRRTKIEGKVSFRGIKNADIVLDNVRVSEADRFAGINSFKDTNTLLLGSRVLVGWQAVGIQFAAFDVARRYVIERQQFGKPLAKFQLVQMQLVEMLANATASLAMVARLAQIQEAYEQRGGPQLRMEQAALLKAFASQKCLETVAKGRALLGGNGIVTGYEMAKIFADAQPVVTFEGTYEVNSLIVGRSITGHSALV